jgi:uncharacterized protein YutE (UPF0331/DUF86 family)
MPRFDPDTMTRLVSELRKSVARLRTLSQLQEQEFLSDPDKIGSAKYHFIVAIESCIDMCNHLISRNGFRVPEDYADTFRVLAEEGAFENEFASGLINMAKFRNRLVHLYWEVNDRQVLEILTTRLKDYEILLKSLSDFLNLETFQK